MTVGVMILAVVLVAIGCSKRTAESIKIAPEEGTYETAPEASTTETAPEGATDKAAPEKSTREMKKEASTH